MFEYLTVDWAAEFGLDELTSESIAELNNSLNGDGDLRTKYFANKSGFASGGTQFGQNEYSCMQMNSMYLEEVNKCKLHNQKFDECSSAQADDEGLYSYYF